MTKPNDIPQDVWKIATRVFGEMLSVPSDVFQEETWVMDTEEIARAILAERERCADCCDQWLAMFGDRGAELQHTSAQEWANGAVSDIASAIRNPNT